MADLVDKGAYEDIINDRPEKFTPEEVGYEAAPLGSAIRCAGCRHYYIRAIDGFSVCEVMRSDLTDIEGVRPDWRCQFQTVDGDVFPLLDEEDE